MTDPENDSAGSRPTEGSPEHEPTGPTGLPETVLEPAAPQRKRRAILISSVAALVALGILAWVVFGGSSATTLALAFSKGGDMHARFSFSMDAEMTYRARSFPVVAQMSGDVSVHVDDVDADGTASITETLSNLTISANGQSVPPGPPLSITLDITKDGDVLSSKGSTLFSAPTDGPAQIGSTQYSALLPDHAVEAGDTWTKTSRETVFGNSITSTSHGTYLRDEQVGSVDAAVVQDRATVPMDFTIKLSDLAQLFQGDLGDIPPDAQIKYGGQMKMVTTSWIDTAAQRVLKTSGTSRYDISVDIEGFPAENGPKGPFSMTGTMQMLLDFS
jgi:hypothetical protein